MTVPEQQPGHGTPGGADTGIPAAETGPQPGFGPPPPQSGPQPGFGPPPPQSGPQQTFGQQAFGQASFGAPPPYGQPGGYPPPPGYGYGYPYGFPGQPQQGGTNGMAIAAMVCGICGFLCLVPGLVGIILGIISLPQVKRQQQSGRGMAITGIVMGGVWIALFVLMLVLGHHGGDVGNGGTSTGSGSGMSV